MKNLKENIIKIFYIIFCIFLLAKFFSLVPIFENSVFFNIFKIIRYLCYGYFFIITLLNYKKLNLFDALFSLLGIVVYYFSKDSSVLTTILVIITCKNFDIHKLLSIAFKIYSVLFALIVFLSIFNIIPDWIYPRGEIPRHSLGFLYPTDCFSIYLIIILLYFAVYKHKYTLFNCFFLEVINIVLYYYTNGRTSFYLITLFLVIMALYKNKKIKSIIDKIFSFKFSKILTYLIPMFIFFISFFFVNLYQERYVVAYRLNGLISGRLSYSSKFLENHEMTLFGEKIDWNGWGGYGYKYEKQNDYEYNFVDSSYIKNVLDYGIIFGFVIIILYTLLLKKYQSDKDFVMYIIIIFILLWCFVEPGLFDLTKNVFILCLSEVLSLFNIKKKGENNEKKQRKK